MTFLLTRPERGATQMSGLIYDIYIHFYSHAPSGAQPEKELTYTIQDVFLLTRPERGATWKNQQAAAQPQNVYSHAPSGAQRT